MLRSMTGFGTASGNCAGVEYAVEAKSVNNRYFKASLKLPDAWSQAEAEFEKLLRDTVARGTVSLSVRMKVSADKAAAKINMAAVNSYIDQLRMVEIEANPTLRIDLANVLQLPGVCEAPELDEVIAPSREGLFGLAREALDALLEMRKREGEALAADLGRNCDVIEQNLDRVAQRAPEVVQEYHKRLVDRVSELVRGAQVPIDQEHLSREVAIYAERSDIAEEANRLAGHLEQFRQAMESNEPAGRKLDFIAQEMLREANTIGSKSSDAEIARIVVDIKTAIDRIKEQAANVE